MELPAGLLERNQVGFSHRTARHVSVPHMGLLAGQDETFGRGTLARFANVTVTFIPDGSAFPSRSIRSKYHQRREVGFLTDSNNLEKIIWTNLTECA